MSRAASRGSSARGTVRLWDELAERERTVAAWRDRTARLEARLAMLLRAARAFHEFYHAKRECDCAMAKALAAAKGER